MIGALLDHLWQSTLFAAGTGLLVLMLRHNAARIRFCLWFAASLKFVIPFAVLTALGGWLLRPLTFPAALSGPTLLMMKPAAAPFSAAGPMLVPPAASLDSAAALLAAWGIGAIAVLAFWLMRWGRLRAALRGAADLPVAAPVPVKSSAAIPEPGLVGIWRPLILLPQGIAAQLSPAEMAAILAHELCHLRRRDNLTAAIHMLVEALFWFHPLIWWIGARLIEERERACDEAVLAGGNDPEVYARGILKVCRLTVDSPLACAAGVAGGDLQMRIEAIMASQAAQHLDAGKKLLLAGAAAGAILVPLLAGIAAAPLPTTPLRSAVAAISAPARVMARRQALAAAADGGPAKVVASHRKPRRAREAAAITQASWQPEQETQAIEQPTSQVGDAVEQTGDDPAAAPEPQAAAAANSNIVLAKTAIDSAPRPTPASDPEPITCRRPEQLPDSRLAGPKVCLPDRTWAELKRQGLDVSPDGRTLFATEEYRSRHGPSCPAMLGSGGGSAVAMALPASFCF